MFWELSQEGECSLFGIWGVGENSGKQEILWGEVAMLAHRWFTKLTLGEWVEEGRMMSLSPILQHIKVCP